MRFFKRYIWILVLFNLFTGCASKDTTAFDPSYVHIVYFWFHNPESLEDQALFETSLKKFLSSSKYAKTNFIGKPPIATRDVVDDSFTYNLTLSFTSAEAQEAYQKEPAHKVFIAESQHLWKKVVVYDAVSIE